MLTHLFKVIAVIFAVGAVGPALAQTTDTKKPESEKATDASGNQKQPQGWTGPINTQSGGAPAESPQGQSPPGMQAAPQGSNKTVKTNEGGVPEGTPKQ